MALIAPCRDCDKRDAECHSSCKEYRDFKAEWEKYRKWEKAHRPKPKTEWMRKWIRKQEHRGG